eukprot:5864873-Amphidinium_carterae.1
MFRKHYPAAIGLAQMGSGVDFSVDYAPCITPRYSGIFLAYYSAYDGRSPEQGSLFRTIVGLQAQALLNFCAQVFNLYAYAASLGMLTCGYGRHIVHLAHAGGVVGDEAYFVDSFAPLRGRALQCDDTGTNAPTWGVELCKAITKMLSKEARSVALHYVLCPRTVRSGAPVAQQPNWPVRLGLAAASRDNNAFMAHFHPCVVAPLVNRLHVATVASAGMKIQCRRDHSMSRGGGFAINMNRHWSETNMSRRKSGKSGMSISGLCRQVSQDFDVPFVVPVATQLDAWLSAGVSELCGKGDRIIADAAEQSFAGAMRRSYYKGSKPHNSSQLAVWK